MLERGSGTTRKEAAYATRGMVTSNHPLASLADNETLLRGGNAVDSAMATMFALTVVEPMMVSIFGAGFVNIRLADGRSTVIDNYATVPNAATPDMFEPVPDSLDHAVRDEANALGHRAVAVGGTLKGWSAAIERYGRLSLAEVAPPAIRFARDGFRVSPYLRGVIANSRPLLERYPDSAAVFLANGHVPEVGDLIQREQYAQTLESIVQQGPDYLYDGPLGEAIAADMSANGGLVTTDDIAGYQIVEREPVRGTVFGHEITGPPPPSSGPAHIIQMLKILEGFDIPSLGFGHPDAVHATAEAMKIAFADRFRYMADPLTTPVPLEWLTSDGYAAERGAEIDLARSGDYGAGTPAPEGNSTTHCTAMDSEGNVVSTTNTIHYAFGSKVTVPGTGVLLNNCMQLMDPVPGRTNSIAAGKRILSSMSPVIVTRDGQSVMALGTPGGLRIFGVVAQGLINVLAYGMSLQEAVEAPGLWGRGLELEQGFDDVSQLQREMERREHPVAQVYTVAGGMNGLLRHPDGRIEGAACWRADGVPMGFSGGDGQVETGYQA